MSWEIRVGDALAELASMDAESVQTCVTSPPYYGLRDYGTGEWEGGDAECEHIKGELRRGVNLAQSSASTRGGARKAAEIENIAYGGVCGKCGAQRIDDQLGLEDTPDEYVARLVEVFREVKRVLRDDGTLWLNLGDSYNNRSVARPSSHQGGLGFENESIERSWADQTKLGLSRLSFTHGGLKEKDLLGIPWMVAFALRADGWYLRSEIIWAKPNPMPESVTDRPTKAHEQVFLLSKSARYYYDADAIREPQDTLGERHEGRSGYRDGHPSKKGGYVDLQRALHPLGRNKRSVWTVATKPYPEAHFATFPPKLIEPMVLAGAPREACGECGAAWERIVEREDAGFDGSRYGERAQHAAGGAVTGGTARSTLGSANGRLTGKLVTRGFAATCEHADRSGAGVVLDPFAGSGTTLAVAVATGRSAIGIELKPEYAELARRRLAGVTTSMFDLEPA